MFLRHIYLQRLKYERPKPDPLIFISEFVSIHTIHACQHRKQPIKRKENLLIVSFHLFRTSLKQIHKHTMNKLVIFHRISCFFPFYIQLDNRSDRKKSSERHSQL